MGKIYFKVLIGIMFILIPSIFLLRMCSDTSRTISNEFSASAMLKKYEYFKDLSAGIDEKRADIEVYKSQLAGIEDHNDFYYQQTQAEMMGLIAMHNRMCSEYNSNMSKFNYSFCNVGTLPASNLTPLPREIKPYILNIN